MNEMRRLMLLIEAMTPDEEDDDRYDSMHRAEVAKTGFYGKAGAGCIIVAQDTGRMLLPKRSNMVEEPHTWGTWGGALDPGDTPEHAVKREVRQEAGYRGQVDITPLYVFKAPNGNFRYYNFLALVDEEFKPVLNWESEAYVWCTLGTLPKPLHFGLKGLLSDAESMAVIRKVVRE